MSTGSSPRSSIFVTRPDYNKPFIDPYDVVGAAKPRTEPAPDDVTVGVDGSTAERPVDLDANLSASQRDRITFIAGPQMEGSHVFRIDCARPLVLLGVKLAAGVHYVSTRDRSLIESLSVWTERDHAYYAQAEVWWRRDVCAELIALNGEDRYHKGWPADNEHSHYQAVCTIANTVNRRIDPTYKGFPKLYSCQHVRQLETPLNPATALRDARLAGYHDQAKFRELIEALQAQTAALLASKPTTLEPRGAKVKE